MGPGSKPAVFSRSCADRISCALKTLLIETVRLAEAEAGRDCISAVCPETCLPELSKRSLSAVHPDLQREIADVVLAPSIPSRGPGSKPEALSRVWISRISALLRGFLKEETARLCSFFAGVGGSETTCSVGCP